MCTCFQVDEGAIREAIVEGTDSVEALGESLRCGINCGWCIPELRKLLRLAHGRGHAA